MKFKLTKLSYLLFFSGLFFATHVSAQIYTPHDKEIFTEKLKLAAEENLAHKPMSEVIFEIGKSFIGTDYQGKILDRTFDRNKEELMVNLSELDCTTFVENTLALSRVIKEGKTSFENFEKELTLVRYRDGKILQYPSRLHYFSDWIYDNSKKGLVKDVTKDIGGIPIKFSLNFMSAHPDSYAQLKREPKLIPIFQKQEKSISQRNYYYIPKDRILAVENLIQTGNLIAITTNIAGLDIGHVGIAVKKEDGHVYFMHAPHVGTKVQIMEETLVSYLAGKQKFTGIIVLRAVEPKVSSPTH